METKKKNGSVVAIVILLILVIILGGYIGYDKFLNKDTINSTEETSTNEINNTENETDDIKNEITNTKTNGECPLTKFDNTYVLTDTDKEDIMNSLESLNAGFTKEVVDINTFSISTIGNSGYYINVKFDCNPKTSDTYASVAKVNGKFKVLTAGSGDTVDGVKRMESTLEKICK